MKSWILIDGYSLMYRAYHALQAPMSAPDGTPTNAVHGFMMMLLKVLSEEEPDGLAVAFDVHEPSFRKGLFEGYKATRQPMPEDLRRQDPVIRALLGRMGIPQLECPGYEADDILGTVSRRCEEEDSRILLVTGDRDSFQLAGEHTTILYTRKGISDTSLVTPQVIREQYGVTARQLIDVKALMGDASDNIPGLPGVGEKTALRLIRSYGDLEGALAAAERESPKLRDKLLRYAEQARLCRKLAEIVRDAPVETDFDAWRPTELMQGVPLLRELGMNVAAKKLAETARLWSPAATEPPPPPPAAADSDLPVEELAGPEALRARCAELTGAPWVSVHPDADFSLATGDVNLRLPLGGDLLRPGISGAEALDASSALLTSCPQVELWNVKALPTDIAPLRGRVYDVMLAAYVLNSQRPSFAAGDLCAGEQIADFARCPARALHELAERQRERLREEGSWELYEELELPLAFVLRDMEQVGFLVDAEELRRLGASFDAQIRRISRQIFDEAGEQFNLNSPRQLGEVLFTHLHIPAQKKNRHGYSTNAEVLESLAERYPICGHILDYRRYQKLYSTYIDPLIGQRDARGRVHSRFDQVGTATGRLSSSDPNLQNIPVRTEEGREIRGAFVARPGWVLVDADYSQIELRVLAHVSGDENMIAAFNAGEDIHARTAAEVYGVPLEAVTPQMRSACKAVNFGIVYGISDFALARNIGVSRAEAKDFIGRYFARYPGVHAYMERSVEEAKAKGYAQTLLGRRRYIPELQSSNYNVRSFGERCAMNSPIQGTAADIIKRAMIRVAEALSRRGMRSLLILQVHDELILECPKEEADEAAALLRECMEGVMPLRVPLRADVSMGENWRACK